MRDAQLRGAALLLALLGAVASAQAYEPVLTHRWLTRQAVEHLSRSDPGRFAEVAAHVEALAAGAEHEDDYFLDGDTDPFTMRSGRHFFRPTDAAGLEVLGTLYVSSLTWGGTAREDNEWDWYDALELYAAGDLGAAYFALGHVLHLLQDATVPAHTHLDVHGPPDGDDLEMYCWFQMTDEHTSRLPQPPPATAVPRFTSLQEAWQRTASASFWRAMYTGDLSESSAAAGEIAQMFPDLSWSWYSESWSIDEPPVGELGADLFEEQPGLFYFKNIDEAAAFDRVDFDPASPRGGALAPNDSGEPMVALLARDLIPVAILHSAGLLQLFLEEAALLEPSAPKPPASEPDIEEGGCASLPPSVLAAAAVLLLLRRRRGAGR